METKRCVAFFRAINVGGRHSLPMKNLVDLLEGMGFRQIKTYIQSGNVIFSRREEKKESIAARVGRAVKKEYHFEPKVHILEAEELEQAMQNNPFPEGETDPKNLHLGFLSEKPANPDLKGLTAVKNNSERFKLIGKVFYLCAPEGIGRSKLAAKSESLLRVSMTVRNWRTVTKVKALLEEDPNPD